MDRETVLLTAATRLETYISRSYRGLNRMELNEDTPLFLFTAKVVDHNKLVDTLNDLFGYLLSASDLGDLFDRYKPAIELDEDAVKKFESTDFTGGSEDDDDLLGERETDVRNDLLNFWRIEGYESAREWQLAQDKASAESARHGDLSLSVNSEIGKHRANSVLVEYEKNTPQDIASYLPDDDAPVSVVGDALGVDLDDDPMQIINVETAVEAEGNNPSGGVTIDIPSFAYDNDEEIVSETLESDIEVYMKRYEVERQDAINGLENGTVGGKLDDRDEEVIIDEIEDISEMEDAEKYIGTQRDYLED